jgi:Arc-like DNA binding domain
LSKLTSFRTTDEVREKLAEAAKARGVSVNQEINDRIAASFDRKDIKERLFEHPSLYGLMKLVMVAMRGAGQRAAVLQKNFFGLDPVTVDDARLWFHDPYAFDQAKRAVEVILEACRPPGSPEPPIYEEADFVAGLRRLGHEYARKLLTEISRNAPGGLVEELRRDLDPALLKQLETAEAGK